ncbi:hypothetical protein N9U75_01245 [Pelagibacteraceae bacterium]|nr:hypothetical protein [Pelagibacteraceae bacterium]
MGYGDDLLITSFASRVKKKYPERQIVIGNASKKEAFHSIIYDNNPNISDCRFLDQNKPVHIIDYHTGNRPYIDYKNSTRNNYQWNIKFKPVPGELYFSKSELSNADRILQESKYYWKKISKKNYKKIIFLETSSTKINDKQFSIKHQNKDWGFENWNNLIKNLKEDFLIIHSKHDKTKKIEGVFVPNNLNFRDACATMNKCDLYVGPEGGFGHVAAALNKKAVLYFGGWISPNIIGYDTHENLYFDDPRSPCGEYKNLCSHCSEARKKISIKFFEERVRKVLET